MRQAPKRFIHKISGKIFTEDQVRHYDIDTPGNQFSGWLVRAEVAKQLGIPLTFRDCEVVPIKVTREYGNTIAKEDV